MPARRARDRQYLNRATSHQARLRLPAPDECVIGDSYSVTGRGRLQVEEEGGDLNNGKRA